MNNRIIFALRVFTLLLFGTLIEAHADSYSVLYSKSAFNQSFTVSKTLVGYLEQTRVATGAYPSAVVWGVGAPEDADGVSAVSTVDSVTGLRITAGTGSLTNHAAAVLVFYNVQKYGSQYIGSIYRWGGAVTYAQSSGSSFNEILVGRNHAIKTVPIAQNIDLANFNLRVFSSAFNNPSGVDGNSTFAVLAWYDSPVPPFPPQPAIPVGQLSVSKSVQRDDADILVSPTNMNTLWTELSVQRASTPPTSYMAGGPFINKPSWTSEISTTLASVIQSTPNAGVPIYFTLFARGLDGKWYFLDYKTVTPYGHVGDFNLATADTQTTTGLLRRTRVDKTPNILQLDISAATKILAPSTTTNAETADLALDIRVNFGTWLAATSQRYLNLIPATSTTALSTLTTTGWTKGTYSASVASNFASSVGTPTVSTGPLVAIFTPWSRPITTGTGTLPGLQLSSPFTLEMYPLSTWSLNSGLVDSTTNAPLTASGSQGSSQTFGMVDVISSVSMSVVGRYPQSRITMVLTDPANQTRLITEDDRTGNANISATALLGDLTIGLTNNGTYTLRLLEQTPVDSASWASLGLTGYAEPNRPGYGWTTIATITFNYTGTVTVNGTVSSVEQTQ